MPDIVRQLVAHAALSEENAERLRAAMASGAPLDEAALELPQVSEPALLRALGEVIGVEYVDLDNYEPPEGLLEQCPPQILLNHHLLPIRVEDGTMVVAASRISDRSGIDELRLATGRPCRLAVAPREEIDRWVRRVLGVGADTVQSLVSSADVEGVEVVHDDADDGNVDLGEAVGASIVRFVNQVLTEAIQARATDVHFEPFENELRIRFRVDGILQEPHVPHEVKRFQAAIVSRLKILSHMDIAEKRVPQDGRIMLRIAGREIDVRVSVIPMLYGEAVVLRLLDRSSALLGLEQLGMAGDDLARFDRILDLPHGIVLVTGPTGSGKTTTLYAALSRINDVARKIVTIEDPIEYQLRGINQIQVASRAGMTFARGLRSILRHDPDVILVGEIRDGETAQIAVQASLTGHLVFSTLHTNDAPGAVTRLVDMGVEPYLVAASLEAASAQRLVRVICSACKQPYTPDARRSTAAELGVELPEVLHHGAGCRQCQGTGYRGRTVICEFMDVTSSVRRMILERASAGEIRQAAMRDGARALRADGWRHVLAGRTTVEEVLRVTKDERIQDDPEPEAKGPTDGDLAGT